MKIALVLCPALYKRCPLIGLGYLSAYLQSKGYGVDIFDLNTMIDVENEEREDYWANRKFLESYIAKNLKSIELLAEKILHSGAEVIGFSVWTTTKFLSLAIAKAVKQKDNNKLIVFGGPECSFSAGELISDDSVDVLICGEGEETFLEVIEMYKKYKKINFCQGAILKNNENIINCGFRPEIENLNNLPFPSFSGFSLDKYYLSNFLPITFYRGCSRRCVFCNCPVTWRKFRSRSVEHIYSEMVHQKNIYSDLKKFEVDDTALNLDLEIISKLSELIISNGLEIEWGGSAIIRSDMNSNLLKKMAGAGCKSLAFGLESGSQNVIDKMRKNFKIEDAERLIRDTHCAGIKVDLNIIIGFPNETEYEFQQTMDFIRRNREFISFVSFPSECWIGNQSYLHIHYDEFGVALGKGGLLWQTEDGINTHEERQKRIKIFNDFINSLGLFLHNYASTKREINTSV